MEYCAETLSSYLERKGTRDETTAYKIMNQIVNGLNEMVKQQIVHRDLKP